MAYEKTIVPVAKSQQKLRDLLLHHESAGVAFVSDPPQEGFHAKVQIDGKTYSIKVMATLRNVGRSEKQEAEMRRIWRVLLYHMKGIFEAADSGVMEFREMMLPYVVTKDGRTVGEHILPKLDAALADNPSRLLGTGT